MKYILEKDDLGKYVSVGQNKLRLHVDRIEVLYQGDIVETVYYDLPDDASKDKKLEVLVGVINYYHDIDREPLPF